MTEQEIVELYEERISSEAFFRPGDVVKLILPDSFSDKRIKLLGSKDYIQDKRLLKSNGGGVPDFLSFIPGYNIWSFEAEVKGALVVLKARPEFVTPYHEKKDETEDILLHDSLYDEDGQFVPTLSGLISLVRYDDYYKRGSLMQHHYTNLHTLEYNKGHRSLNDVKLITIPACLLVRTTNNKESHDEFDVKLSEDEKREAMSVYKKVFLA